MSYPTYTIDPWGRRIQGYTGVIILIAVLSIFLPSCTAMVQPLSAEQSMPILRVTFTIEGFGEGEFLVDTSVKGIALSQHRGYPGAVSDWWWNKRVPGSMLRLKEKPLDLFVAPIPMGGSGIRWLLRGLAFREKDPEAVFPFFMDIEFEMPNIIQDFIVADPTRYQFRKGLASTTNAPAGKITNLTVTVYK